MVSIPLWAGDVNRMDTLAEVCANDLESDLTGEATGGVVALCTHLPASFRHSASERRTSIADGL